MTAIAHLDAEAAAVASDRPVAQRLGTLARVRRSLWSAAPPAAMFGLVVGVWYGISYWVLIPKRRFLLPPPHEVVRVGILDSANRAEIITGLTETTKVALTGLLISSCFGILAAVVMSQARWVERTLYPYAVFLQTIPVLAIVPLVGFWWGFNFRSRVMVCVLLGLFPILTNTLFGLKSASSDQHDLFRLARASRVQRLRMLQGPAALPSLFTGLRIAAGGSVIGAIVGDFFFRQGTPGIGRLIDNYQSNLQSERLLTAMFGSALLGIVMFTVIGAIGERLIGEWSPTAKGRGAKKR